MRVMATLDELEDRDRRFALRLEAALDEKLRFERRVEALAHRVVKAIADRSHGSNDARRLAAFSKRDRRVLRSVGRVMDNAARLATIDRHIEGVDHDLFAHMIGHRPTDHAPTEYVQHDGEKEEARPRRDVGDVGDPELIRGTGGKVAVHQIRCRFRVAVADGRHDPLAPRSPVAMSFVHQPGDPSVAGTNALVVQFGLNSRTPVGGVRLTIDRFNAVGERDVAKRPRCWSATAPRVKATHGDFQNSAEHRDGVLGLVRSHESEGFLGIVSASRANQAAAFERISCSCVSRFTSRRRRVSSLRSSEFSRSSRRPESASFCFSQFMIVCRETSS
jgi:hypothetical protein